MKSVIQYVRFRQDLRKRMIKAIFSADAPALENFVKRSPSQDAPLVEQMWNNYLPLEMAVRGGFAKGVSMLLRAGAKFTPGALFTLADNLQSKEPDVRAGAEDILQTLARDGLTLEEWDMPLMFGGQMTTLREILAERFLEAAPGDPYYTAAPEAGIHDDVEIPQVTSDRPAPGAEQQMWKRPTPWSSALRPR